MARIRLESKQKTQVFNSLVDASLSIEETNDCSVKAVAVALDVAYDVAHALCEKAGRVKGKGLAIYQILKALELGGKKAEQVMSSDYIAQYPGVHVKCKNVTTHHPERFSSVWADGRTYLFFTRSHVAAVKNGVNHDWTKGSAKRVEQIYEVLA